MGVCVFCGINEKALICRKCCRDVDKVVFLTAIVKSINEEMLCGK